MSAPDRHGLLLLPALLLASLAPAQRTPDEALRALEEGNRRFAADHSVPQPIGQGVRRTLARGESPYAVVLCCSDSRVPPEHVFNCGLGELVVVRVAGHVADPEAIASIEFAVEQLGAPLCVVLGHEGCTVVAESIAMHDGKTPDGGRSEALQQLLERIEPAVKKGRLREVGGKALADVCEEEHAHLTSHDVLRRSELLRRYASVGRFRMVAARYHQDSGEIEWLPTRPLPQPESARALVQPGAVPSGLPPHVALRMLQSGHRRFLGDSRPEPDLGPQRREQLEHGQQPLAIVVTCADSRVAPEHVFDAGLGDLCVIRLAGNTLNDDALATIEYAAGHYGASLLVVMGHTHCTTIEAAERHLAAQAHGRGQGHGADNLTPSQRALLLRLEPSLIAAQKLGKGQNVVDLAARENARRAIAEARSRSALLRELEQQGRFAMLATIYDVGSGDITWIKEQSSDDDLREVAHAAKQPANGGHGAAPQHHAPNDAHGDAAHGDVHGNPDDGHAPAPNRRDSMVHGDHGHTVGHEGAHGSDHGSAHGNEPGNHGALPVLDWAAAPAGETIPTGHGAAHGNEDSHDAHGSHGAPDPHAAHEGHGAHDGHAADGHGAHDPHEGHGAHEQAEGDDHSPSHGDHDDDGHGAAHGSAHEAPAHGQPAANGATGSLWTDPVVIVGLLGIGSLLVAALMALKGA